MLQHRTFITRIRAVLRRAASLAAAVVVLAHVPAMAQTDPCTQPALAALVAPQPLTVEGASTHIYKSAGGIELRAHVIAPDRRTADRVPAAVFFFGGGWKWGSVTEALPAARYLASRGMVAVIADYRVWCRHRAGIADQIADARSAIRWVRANATRLGIDPNLIVATGGSAGGHLALSTAIFDRFDEPSDDKTVSAKPNALVLLFPCVDLTSEEERRASHMVIGNHGEDVSPLFHVSPNLPPMAIYQGTDDPIYADVVKFAAAAKAAGVLLDFKVYEGARHGFTRPQVENGRWFREVWAEADRFLTAQGYRPAPSQGPK
jgi:acetyl esterase